MHGIIYGQRKDYVSFDSINNLFHPSTIDACYMHDGHGNCPGIKHNGSWNISGHKDRIVHYDELGLKVLCETFEENGNGHSTKLVSIHAKEILEVLESLEVCFQVGKTVDFVAGEVQLLCIDVRLRAKHI